MAASRQVVRVKLVQVVIPQTRQDEFVQQFLIEFQKTDWSNHSSGEDWPYPREMETAASAYHPPPHIKQFMDKASIETLLYESEATELVLKRDQYPLSNHREKSEFIKDILAFANEWRQVDAYPCRRREGLMGEATQIG